MLFHKRFSYPLFTISLKKLLAGLSFLIALSIYTITLEPSASFWDCGEYIASAYKLQIPHPPGAPFFLLLLKCFSLLAGNNALNIAWYMNMCSVFTSAAIVMISFYIIYDLGIVLVRKTSPELTCFANQICCIGSFLGSLILICLDSFWTISTETETYSLATLFVVIIIWFILQFEKIPLQDVKTTKYLICISYLLGLSLGVRMYALLIIPALGFVFYKKYQRSSLSLLGLFLTFLISGCIILSIFPGIFIGLPTLFLFWEFFFTNTLHLTIGSGSIIILLLLILGLILSIYHAHLYKKRILHIVLLCLTYLLIGYASYGLVLIRAHHNPSINQNNPKHWANFLKYLKREQYGGNPPLLYGPYFNAPIIGSYKEPIYVIQDNCYQIKDYKTSPVYAKSFCTFLPRMHSAKLQQVQSYENMFTFHNTPPSFSQNLYFLFKHQLGHYYFRYFFWNFIGRLDDTRNSDFTLPKFLFKKKHSSTSHGTNYLLFPFLLGLFGMFFQFKRSRHYFWMLLLLWFMFSIGLVFYFNMTPLQVRERDYFFVPSFILFTYWIGLGIIGLLEKLLQDRYRLKSRFPKVGVYLSLVFLMLPIEMLIEGYPIHNRAGRYFAVDSAKNLLSSCAPQAILFTGGDNDTFPLWYVQEVEGFRKDVRVVTLSYLDTDWYIQQMKRDVNESKGLPIALEENCYRQHGENDYLPLKEMYQNPISIGEYLYLIQSKDQRIQLTTQFGNCHIVPHKRLILNIGNRRQLQKIKHQLDENLGRRFVKKMEFNLKQNYITKKDLVLLDLLYHNAWERPIYFNFTSLEGISVDLKDYVLQEGFAMRLLPIKKPKEVLYQVNMKCMYENVMKKSSWRNLDKKGIYYDENHRNILLNHRVIWNILIYELIRRNELEKASKVVDECLRVIPNETIPYDKTSLGMIQFLFTLRRAEKACEISKIMIAKLEEYLENQLKLELKGIDQIQEALQTLYTIIDILRRNDQKILAENAHSLFSKYYQLFYNM